MDLESLLTIKSKDPLTQRSIIDEMTHICVTSQSIDLRKVVGDDALFDLTNEPLVDVIRYCLLAIYAADIASVPHAKGRKLHLSHLRDLAQHYNLSYDSVLHLTRYERAILDQFKRHA